jgi:uncharacterized protein YdeI (YjbR/CyaY-like superfamily)
MPTRSALTSFATPAALRSWLTKHHATESELMLQCFKIHAGARGVTYKQALDEALCFGWIDGVRRRLDHDSFSVRFSPRTPRSVWSRVNVGHVERLLREGRMMKPGLAAFRARDAKRTAVYSFENRPKAFPPALEKAFRSQGPAWAFFMDQAPWYRRTTTYWVMSAKREETRVRRFEALVECCGRRTTIPQLPKTK